jgi:hypothetical protein
MENENLLHEGRRLECQIAIKRAHRSLDAFLLGCQVAILASAVKEKAQGRGFRYGTLSMPPPGMETILKGVKK